MADDKKKDKDSNSDDPGKDVTSDSGLGNLPPLSDFDSQGGFGSDSGALPPLGSFDSEASDKTPSDSGGGLPPISDIDVETPNPTGGNVRPAPSGFDSGVRDTFSSGSGGFSSGGGSGFQDLAADSDFSPETPEIGPGPDSNVDTPMFDSAFGGNDMGFGGSGDTPQPTQAMETPMFGGAGAGFDEPDFGGGQGGGDFGGFDQGTPAPDFSPDTGMGGFTPPTGGGGPAGGDGGDGRSGASPVVLGVAAVAALLIGILLGPIVAGFLPLPAFLNPTAAELADKELEVQRVNAELRRLLDDQARTGPDDPTQTIQELIAQRDTLRSEVDMLSGERDAYQNEVDTLAADLAVIEQDVADRNEEFILVQEQYEDLVNETAIIQARQRGLISEVDRLTGQVGQLEEANERSVATRGALAHAVDRLLVQVKESIPLTPEKFAHHHRVSAVESLRDRVGSAKWVDPQLMDAYTELYLMELEIAQAQEYFFAKLSVTDEYGNTTKKWAECLMRGNWAVFYRTFDGKNIGSFTNIGSTETPRWGYQESLPTAVRREIEATIIDNRVDGWQEKVALLAEKQLMIEEGTAFQRAFSSL